MDVNAGYSKPATIAKTEDTSSSSDKKAAESLKTQLTEDEDDAAEQKPTVVDKGLSLYHLTSFGFNLAEEAKRHHTSQDHGATKGFPASSKGAARSKTKNQNVVYGGEPSDHTDFGDHDYDDHDYPVVDDDDDLSNEGDQEAGGGNEEESFDYERKTAHDYFSDYTAEADDMWEDEEEVDEEEAEEDEEELERLQQEAFDAAVLAAEEERERIRDLRLAEIREKKESLIERYLKVARVMINHRKKNIYLQDYLYHLALRKGVLRGDPQFHGSSGHTMNLDESDANKGVKRKIQRKNAMIASRFARFLRKTGHFYDDEVVEDRHHHYHHRNDPAAIARSKNRHLQHHLHPHHKFKSGFMSTNNHGHHHHHHFHAKRKNFVPITLVRKNSQTCPEALEGKTCPLSKKTKSKIKLLRSRHHLRNTKSGRNVVTRGDSEGKDKPRTLQDILEEKAAATIRRMLKNANEALEAFERHRCRMAKKKQLIKITKLLERQYSGTSIQDMERYHLVSFVETSVKAQNIAKKKALRRQQRNQTQNKTSTVNLNHQWIKSLERIRELRLKKAKLEQEHRLLLMRKVRYWNIWEKRAATALEAVPAFITEMAVRVSMSRAEALTFRHGMDQFHKQLHTLHEAMLQQVVRKFKAECALCMTQRKAKDNESVAAPTMKGFTISDYERMIIENQESHQKLVERQAHLLEQYEKLKKYIKQVANSHLQKQRTWGALRTGRHDMKQLWQLCAVERDNLLRKLRDISRVQRLHSRLFMQISVLENKRLFNDFQNVTHKVKELKDVKRNFQTQLLQAQSMLRVLNVRYMDTRQRTEQASTDSVDRVDTNSLQYCKDTISQRIAPRVPNTIHSLDECGKKPRGSLFKQESNRVGTSTPTQMTPQKYWNQDDFAQVKQSTKLPRV